jgi:hypothetical protein
VIRHGERIGTGVFFVAIFALLLRKLSDYDVWYHLAIGREILRAGALPTTEFLTYSGAGQPTDYPEWGYALLAHLTQTIAGDWGLASLNALLATVTLYALYLAAVHADPRPDAQPAARWLVVLGVLAVTQFRWVYRPEMMLFVALAVTIHALESYRRDPVIRRLAVIPALGLLLSQFHPSALFLPIVLAPYALETAIAAGRQARWRTLLPFAVIGAATLALASLNPYGWKQVWLPVEFALQRELLQGITEFLPALQTPYAVEFVVTATAGFAAVALQRPFRIAHALLFVFFVVSAFQHVRNLALLALVALVPLATLCNGLAARFMQSTARRMVVFGAVLLIGAGLTFQAISNGGWGAGPAPGLFPVAAADALEHEKPPGRIFNFYDTGGYLAWRADSNGRVFIDGRHYENDWVLQQHNAVFSAAPTWREILARHRVGAIVAPTTLRYSGALIPLIAELARDSNWSPIAVDAGGTLFALSAFAHRPLPWSAVWEQALRDASAIYGAFPDQHEALLTMSVAYHELGKISSALESLESYVNKNPDRDESKALLDRWRAESSNVR